MVWTAPNSLFLTLLNADSDFWIDDCNSCAVDRRLSPECAAVIRCTGPDLTAIRARIASKHAAWTVHAALPERTKETTMADDKQERAKAIEAALAQIDKQFGKGSIMRLGSRETIDVPAIPTGSLSLDAALGVGGVPRGRVIEIFGPESSGKTTLSLHVIAEAQRRGGMAAFVDAEHALDAVYAGKLGVDIDNLLVSQPDSGEQALEIAEVLIRSGRRRRAGGRLGGGARPPLRARGRDGRRADGPAGPADEPGAPQAHGHRLEEQDQPDLHQPAAREDRRDVRQPRDHDGRPRAQVLLVGAPRHPPHRLAQGRRGRSSAAAPR